MTTVQARIGMLAAAGNTARRVYANLAYIDWLVLAFHTFMVARVSLAPPSENATLGLTFSLILWTVTVTTLVVVRGEVLSRGRVRTLVYRVGIPFGIATSYFKLKFYLPALEPVLLDPVLLRIDEAIIGVTPAVFFETFNQPAYVEWFAFFYYWYFVILGAHVFGVLILGDGRIMRELGAGVAMVIAFGHTLYTLVPGVGPVAYMAFEQPLQGGFWLQTVQSAVESSGAHIDIFPSLHTLFPTFFVLFGFRYRKNVVFKYAWPIVTFCAANIVIATLFLRWHYAIDVAAGLILAVTILEISKLIARKEAARESPDRQLDWEEFLRLGQKERARSPAPVS